MGKVLADVIGDENKARDLLIDRLRGEKDPGTQRGIREALKDEWANDPVVKDALAKLPMPRSKEAP